MSHSVWLYFRFALSYRDVEEIMAVRGITLTSETIREGIVNLTIGWCNRLERAASSPNAYPCLSLSI